MEKIGKILLNNGRTNILKNEELLKKQKSALTEARKKIKECIKFHSKTLEIGYNGYLIVFPEEIRNLTWLTSLSVVCTEIKTIPSWIGELTNLRTLDISSNQKLKKLPMNIQNLKKLKKLDLDNTGIQELPSFIGNIKSLELLSIDIWDLKIIPQEILDLPKLIKIETRGRNISHLPALAKKVHELNHKEALRRIEQCRKQKKEKLDLSYLYLGKLPEELLKLKFLEILILCCNELKKLPDWIDIFSNLKKLDISTNEITFLPSSIGNLKNLKIIDLSFNKIAKLPESFGNLSSLEDFTLNEEANHPKSEELHGGQASWLEKLPESFGNLSSLKDFHIYCTKITKLPESFGKLKSLKSFYVGGDVDYLSNTFFPKNMNNLKSLTSISISPFDKVPDFISEMKNLKHLDLSHNIFRTLPDFIGNLKKLRILNLHSTWINEVPLWILNLKNLVDLDLSNNDISIDPKILGKLPKLKKYSDEGNPFHENKLKKKEKIKTVKKLSNKELQHYAMVASDSILLNEALFDGLNPEAEAEKENLSELVSELTQEIKKRKGKNNVRKIRT